MYDNHKRKFTLGVVHNEHECDSRLVHIILSHLTANVTLRLQVNVILDLQMT